MEGSTFVRTRRADGTGSRAPVNYVTAGSLVAARNELCTICELCCRRVAINHFSQRLVLYFISLLFFFFRAKKTF